MKKTILLILGIFIIVVNVQAQSKIRCSDTVIAYFKKYEDFKLQIEKAYNSGYYLNDTIYFTKNRKARKRGEKVLEAFNHSKFYNCGSQSQFKFFQFYTRKNKLIAEGFWDLEGFQGLYREYYKTSKLKEEGYRNGDLKIKNWKYYNESGKLIKEEEYDDKGNLIATKNY